ncbi:MAG: glycosyltransferase family 9 protein [Nanoarchaeota archaeon]|nr:glycosyltransferase family 9 protein [Nanoarchaeota archaeon]
MKLKRECKYFKGHIPCTYHKTHKIEDCSKCKFYKPIEKKILIIKVGALGDVIRTTTILPALRKKCPNHHIAWLIKEDSKEVLEGHQLLDEVLIYNTDTLARLQVEKYDLVINLDKDPPSTSIAMLVKSPKKLGFGSDENGKTIFFNEEAQYLYENGINDNLNKKNQKSYQQMMFEAIALPYNGEEYSVVLNSVDANFVTEFMRKYDIKSTDTLIGINTGASPRWPLKKWHTEKFIELINKLSYELGAKVILLGGLLEVERNFDIYRQMMIKNAYEIEKEVKIPIIDATRYHSLSEFSYLVNLCDVVVTGDTAPMHIAISMKKPVAALFGPTSAREIELYGRGVKIVPDMDCLGCYNTKCDKKPNCMDLIQVQEVYDAIVKLIRK